MTAGLNHIFCKSKIDQPNFKYCRSYLNLVGRVGSRILPCWVDTYGDRIFCSQYSSGKWVPLDPWENCKYPSVVIEEGTYYATTCLKLAVPEEFIKMDLRDGDENC